MTFCEGAGVIACIDRTKSLYVAPSTAELKQELIDAGYMPGTFFVPFIDGTVPADDRDRNKWGELINKAEETNRIAEVDGVKASYLPEYRVAAQKKGVIKNIDEIMGGWNAFPKNSIVTDNLKINYQGAKRVTETNSGFSFNSQVAASRREKIGTYNIGNTVIGFIDEKGAMRVTPLTTKRIESLRAAGYTQDGAMSVPLSDVVFTPANEALASQWELMKEKAALERSMERRK